ncbi:hypothetical protein FQN53_006812 [Emmonsiellopsis sp. PD_33]|nr:hypothetical protein FQN53_006812 [Emmonsiellopsis sp. PD_33]KAK2797526.1 hypothetical protein FQN51_008425 [Onygenales sp. PD_10]
MTKGLSLVKKEEIKSPKPIAGQIGRRKLDSRVFVAKAGWRHERLQASGIITTCQAATFHRPTGGGFTKPTIGTMAVGPRIVLEPARDADTKGNDNMEARIHGT